MSMIVIFQQIVGFTYCFCLFVNVLQHLFQGLLWPVCHSLSFPSPDPAVTWFRLKANHPLFPWDLLGSLALRSDLLAGHMSPAEGTGWAGLGSPVQNSGCSAILLLWVGTSALSF